MSFFSLDITLRGIHWKLCSYQHVLNGERKSQPSHARGGILADEMGLGKTLVILSVIAGTLALAKEFEGLDIEESQPQIEPQIQPQPKLNSQATLILVPSTRTLLSPIPKTVYLTIKCSYYR